MFFPQLTIAALVASVLPLTSAAAPGCQITRYDLTEIPLNAPQYGGFFIAKNIQIGPTFCAELGLCQAQYADMIVDTGSSDFWVLGLTPSINTIGYNTFDCTESLTCSPCSGSTSKGGECYAGITYAAGTAEGVRAYDLVAGVYDEKVEFGLITQMPTSKVYPGGTWGLAFNALAVSIYVPCLHIHNPTRYLHFNSLHICFQGFYHTSPGCTHIRRSVFAQPQFRGRAIPSVR